MVIAKQHSCTAMQTLQYYCCVRLAYEQVPNKEHLRNLCAPTVCCSRHMYVCMCLVSTAKKGLAPVLCSCRHTEQYPEMQIYDDCVVINDAFPKARCHALVIARQEGLNGPADLRPEHLPLLKSMQVMLQIICAVQSNICSTLCCCM